MWSAVVGVPIVSNVMQGFNACCFAYGQTGAGKTHTMQGELAAAADGSVGAQGGLMPRMFEHIFAQIEQREAQGAAGSRQYKCECSYLQIYNESISDLLQPASKNLKLRYRSEGEADDKEELIYVEGLEWQSVVNGVFCITH